ncbi:hypothetical protein HDU97_006631 [Phlyctochytrium planicorne]|nr:hypothetical protein HDU97_006631 [Phlyctochytrium planicorne]
MCGRTVMALEPDDLQRRTRASTWTGREYYRKSHNVGPGRSYPVMVRGNPVRRAQVRGRGDIGASKDSPVELYSMRWGLIPSFMKEKPDSYNTINAREDSIRARSVYWAKPSEHQRCVIPIQGFFEWQRKGKEKKPYFIYSDKPGELLYIAGLWDKATIAVTEKDRQWQAKLAAQKALESGDGEGISGDTEVEVESGGDRFLQVNKEILAEKAEWQDVYSFAVVTTDMADQLAWLHDRMPVFLWTEEDREKWLNPEKPFCQEIEDLMKPSPSGLKWHAVSPFMNKIGNDTPECIVPITEKKGTLFKFLKPAASSEVLVTTSSSPGTTAPSTPGPASSTPTTPLKTLDPLPKASDLISTTVLAAQALPDSKNDKMEMDDERSGLKESGLDYLSHDGKTPKKRTIEEAQRDWIAEVGEDYDEEKALQEALEESKKMAKRDSPPVKTPTAAPRPTPKSSSNASKSKEKVKATGKERTLLSFFSKK